MEPSEILSLLGSFIGIICSISVLYTFSKNIKRDSENTTKKNVLQEQAITNLGDVIKRYQTTTDERFDKLETGLNTLTETVRTRDFEFAKLQWEHNQRICDAKNKKEA